MNKDNKEEPQRTDESGFDGKTVSRREFLKLAGIAGAGVTLAGGMGGLLAACGGEEETTTTTAAGATTTTTAAGETTTSVSTANALADWEAQMEAEYLKQSSVPEVVLTDEVLAGPKSTPGKKILNMEIILGCDVCKDFKDQVDAGGKILGWEILTIDPNGDPVKMTEGIERGISAKIDGAIIWVIDAKDIKAPLQKLKDLGIPVVSNASTDAPEDFYLSDATPAGRFEKEGWLDGLAAWYWCKQSNQPFRAIWQLNPAQDYSRQRGEGFQRFVDEAQAVGADVQLIDTIEILATDLGTPNAQSKAVTAIQKNADYTVFGFAADSFLIEALAGAKPTGLADGTKIWVSTDASPATLEDIRAGGPSKASNGTSQPWLAYSGLNDLVRVFGGQKALGGEGAGFPSLVCDKNNLPAVGVGWSDYMKPLLAEAYGKLWGVA